MNCAQSQQMLDDYIDGTLSPIQLDHLQSHLKKCDVCQHSFSQAQALLLMLKDAPVPPAKKGYEQRVLNFLEKKSTNKSHQHHWFTAGFTSAIAASLVVWLSVSPISIFSTSSNGVNTVNLTVKQIRKVDLVFNTATELNDATLTIELPEKIEVSGYLGKRKLKWTTSFKKGTNRLALPLIAKEEHDGVLIASLRKNGKTKIFHIYIDSHPPTSSLFIKDGITTTTNT